MANPRVTIGGITAELPPKIRGFTDLQSDLYRVAMQTIQALNIAGGSVTYVTNPDYGATGDGVTDDTDAIAAALAAVTASDTAARHIHFPPGRYKVTPPTGVALDEYCFVVPSNTLVTMDPGATILMTGQISACGPSDPYYHVFRVQDGSTNIVFDGINVEGENSPFEAPDGQNQSAAIDIWLVNTTDVVVRNSTFKNLFGFSVHDRGGNKRISAINNRFIECGNGLNVCSDYSLQIGNEFYTSEGVEASGRFTVISNNCFFNPIGISISAGGNVGAGVTQPGMVISNNTIEGGDQSGGGIILAEACVDSIVSNNSITGTTTFGISVATSGTSYSYGNLIVGNVCRDIVNGAASSTGLLISGGGSEQHVIMGNICNGAMYGLIMYADDCVVTGNYFSGTFHDASYNVPVINASLNIYANNTQEYVGTSVELPFDTTSIDLNNRNMTYGSAAPVSGTHVRGDIVFNNAPSAGGFMGWTCTASGTPGTWKTWGAISA